MDSAAASDTKLLQSALQSAVDTRRLEIARGARWRAAEVFAGLFGGSAAVVVADENTFAAAGRDVVDSLRVAGETQAEPIVLPAQGLYAEFGLVDEVRRRLESLDAAPIAVGSGTINDLVKLAAHQLGRPYMAVATAASMDGYTAYGASITYQGSKQTFECPAPAGVVADLDVIAAAPEGMNASGYADLIAKRPAGADWIAADFLGEEPIHYDAWRMVQEKLGDWTAHPEGVLRGDFETARRVTLALMMTGFAMQAARSSRPASGAEHQFSHLWDMQHHTHHGVAPSHGFKVGIGTLASLRLYEELLRHPIDELNVDDAAQDWPDASLNQAEIEELFSPGELREKASLESAAKHISHAKLRMQLEKLKTGWPELKRRLSQQLLPAEEMRQMLRAAGAPDTSEDIGISAERLARSYVQAYHIRRRFTVLDLARRCGLLQPFVDSHTGSPSRTRATAAATRQGGAS